MLSRKRRDSILYLFFYPETIFRGIVIHLARTQNRIRKMGLMNTIRHMLGLQA